MKFFKCEKCGKIVAMVKESACDTMCCGEAMKEIVANTVDAAKEKHVPEYKVNGNVVEVNVGSVEHPMTEEHLIEWVSLETEQGNQRKILKAGQAPKVCFAICEGDKVKNVYAYCNLHGLWKA
jgi:superoxide reductase